MWKNVKNYEGYYQVSCNGIVKRIESFRKNGANGYFQKEKILKQTLRSEDNYLCVNLSKNGVSKVINVHRIVAEAFLENKDNKPQVNHRDGDKLNNNVSNLEWVTAKENINHCDKILGRKRNIDGLKLGAIASTKKNLNVTNGIEIFQTYEEIKNYLEKKHGLIFNIKSIRIGVRESCIKKNKRCGFYWEYVK